MCCCPTYTCIRFCFSLDRHQCRNASVNTFSESPVARLASVLLSLSYLHVPLSQRDAMLLFLSAYSNCVCIITLVTCLLYCGLPNALRHSTAPSLGRIFVSALNPHVNFIYGAAISLPYLVLFFDAQLFLQP